MLKSPLPELGNKASHKLESIVPSKQKIATDLKNLASHSFIPRKMPFI